MRLITKISEILVAILFLFSGFAKAVNPFGLSIQVADYMAAMHLDFLTSLAPTFAILLPVVEMVLGVMLFLGLYKKFTSWTVMLFMGFFTILTLWIAVYNPVKDCGCFGDLLKISNWETFTKNIIFLIPTVILFINRGEWNNAKHDNAIFKVVGIAILLAVLPVYTTFSLPIIDSTPYKKGTNLYEALHDGTPDVTVTTLLYKNLESGEVEEFEINDPEWQDETKWEFVDSKTEVVEAGNSPTIKELPMIDRAGIDRSEEVLLHAGKVLIIAVQEPLKEREKIERVVRKYMSDEPEIKVVILHSSVNDVDFGIGIEVYATDQTILRTLIQNRKGGYLVLNNGIVTTKSVI